MKKLPTSTPHDALFKTFLRHPDTARDFLAIHLPATLLGRCDLQTLTLESTSFVEPDLRAYYSDILWSLETCDGAGYIYVIIEHQSAPDAHMAFRLLRYALAAMQQHLDAGHKQLPLVVPMLFYHGTDSPYPFSLCWLDEFADPAMARQLYTAAFPLVDITMMPDDEIMQHRRIALLELIQKHIRQRDLLGLVDRIASLLVTGCTNDRQLKALFNYLLIQHGHTPRFISFLEEMAERVPQHKERLMTITERFRNAILRKGIREGILQGKQEGLAEGQRAAARRIALLMLEEGIDRQTIQKLTGLSAEEMQNVVH